MRWPHTGASRVVARGDTFARAEIGRAIASGAWRKRSCPIRERQRLPTLLLGKSFVYPGERAADVCLRPGEGLPVGERTRLIVNRLKVCRQWVRQHSRIERDEIGRRRSYERIGRGLQKCLSLTWGDEVPQPLSTGRHHGVQLDDAVDGDFSSRRDASDHHPGVAVPNQNDVRRTFSPDHIVDVRVEIDVSALRSVTTETSEGDGQHPMARGLEQWHHVVEVPTA